MLDHLAHLATSPWLYLIVAIAVAVDGFLPMMPSEPLLLGAIAATATHPPRLAILIMVVMAAVMAGDAVAYTLGRRMHGRIAHRHNSAAAVYHRVHRALGRHGAAAVVTLRFIPCGRVTANLVAGATALPRHRFTIFSGAGGLLWAGYQCVLGGIGGLVFSGRPMVGVLTGLALGLTPPLLHQAAVRCRRRLRRPGRIRRAPAASPVRDGSGPAYRRPRRQAGPAAGIAAGEFSRPSLARRPAPVIRILVFRDALADRPGNRPAPPRRRRGCRRDVRVAGTGHAGHAVARWTVHHRDCLPRARRQHRRRYRPPEVPAPGIGG